MNSALRVKLNFRSLAVVVSAALFSPARVEAETRAYVLQNCPSAAPAASSDLAATLLPGLVEKGIGAIAAAVRKAAAETKTAVGAEINSHFFSGDPGSGLVGVSSTFGCLVLVDGAFEAGRGAGKNDSEGSDERKRVVTWLRTQNLAGDPRLYFEGLISPSDDRTAFEVLPWFLHYPKRLGSRLSWFRDYEAVVNVTLYPPNGESESKAFSLGIVSLGRVVGTKWAGSGLLPKSSTRWMKPPGLPVEANAAIADIKAVEAALEKVVEEVSDCEAELPYATGNDKAVLDRKLRAAKRNKERLEEQKQATAQKHRVTLERFLPYTARVELVETRSASQFLAAVADLIEGAKDPAKDAVAKALDPGDPEADAARQAAAELTAVQARHAVEMAELALATVPSGDAAKLLSAQQTLVIRQLEANAAYAKAGWPVPYPAARP